MIAYLTGKGAKVTPQLKRTLSEEEFPTLLCNAASKRDLETIRLLVQKGASIDAGDYDQRCCLSLL